MDNEYSYDQAVARIRRDKTKLTKLPPVEAVIAARTKVLTRYQPIFSPSNAGRITDADFRSFLIFENNQHWTGLNRQGGKICSDMDRLRDALVHLVDESHPIAERVDYANSHVSGMGKAIITAILLCTYPDKYGVWNRISEKCMQDLEVWPREERGESLGTTYAKVNTLLRRLSADVQVDLWTLDTFFWGVLELWDSSPPDLDDEETGETHTPSTQGFGLERHLQEFLMDNWERTSLGKDWMIYSEGGDDEKGYEYQCSVGRIDLLARHRIDPKWLVIELKRNQSSDVTIGQVLRYIGWVRQNLAKPAEEVRGLVIARETDESLKYALSSVSNVDVQVYEVEFRLHPASPAGQAQ